MTAFPTLKSCAFIFFALLSGLLQTKEAAGAGNPVLVLAAHVGSLANRMKKPKTPCIGICSTVFGDEVCRGCKRFMHEVIDWNSYDDEQKNLVLGRLRKFATQVVSGKIQVLDVEQFSNSLEVVGLDKDLIEAVSILNFLRKSAKQIKDLSAHGLQALPEYAEHNAEAIKLMIEEEILILSQATYNSSFKRNFRSSDPGSEVKSGRNIASNVSNSLHEEMERETSRI